MTASISDWEAEDDEGEKRAEMMLRAPLDDEAQDDDDDDDDGDDTEEGEDEAMEVAWARGGTMSEGRTHQRTIDWRNAYTVSSGSTCCDSVVVVVGGLMSISSDL